MLDGRLQADARSMGARTAVDTAGVGWPTFAFVFTGLFLIATIISQISTVHHDVTEIVMWSGTGWQLGFWKHPPFLPWLFRAAFSIFGENRITIAGLTALNVTLGAWAVWRIAILCLGDARAARALGLYALSPLVTVLALKLNHNAILVSLWPLTVLAFLRVLRRPTVLNGVLLGLMAGVTMLAKYYSALLLVSMLVALLASRDRWGVLRSPAPWIAALVALAVWGPNLWWIAHHDLQPIQYAMTPEKVGPWRFLAFGVSALGLLSPVVIAAAWLARRSGVRLTDGGTQLAHGRELAIISVLPFLLTMALTLSLGLRGATLWALPIFSLVPILLAARLPAPSPAHKAGTLRRLPVLLLVLLPLTLAVELTSVRYGATTGEPRAEIVGVAERLWRETVGATPIRYVAGETRLVSEAALSLPDHPVGWPNFDFHQATWMIGADTATTGLLVLCGSDVPSCLEQSDAIRAQRGGFSCEISAQRTIGPVRGRRASVVVQVIVPAGLHLSEKTARSGCAGVAGQGFSMEPAQIATGAN